MNARLRVPGVAALIVLVVFGCALRAGAQSLWLPLTGHRIRPIDPEALFHTLFHDVFLESDGTTYVQTGDIPAMWLRDSSQQMLPYVRFQSIYPSLRPRFTGVIERNARNILLDSYANAFQESGHVWERKWEPDSLAWPVLLASVYWRTARDRSIFTGTLHKALATIVDTYACEQHHSSCGRYAYSYHVSTHEEYNERTGLIWSGFRPSDDPVAYRFNIPQNMIAVVGLRAIASLAVDGYGDTGLAQRASDVARSVYLGIATYGRMYDAKRKYAIYAYEVDGYGGAKAMDDANIPNLLTLPYIGWCSAYDPLYLQTRAFVLSHDNPYYFSGRYAAGLGSPHTPAGYVWPLGIIGRALTSTSSAEISEALTELDETQAGSTLFHESFNPDAFWKFTRPEFGWADALGAELLFRTLAGYETDPFIDGTIVPFEQYYRTPALAGPETQLENRALVIAALGRLLSENR